MKSFGILLVALVFSCFAAVTHGQQVQVFKNLEIRQQFQDTPRISSGNIPEDYTYQQKWFQIDVRYETLEQKIRGYDKKFAWLDDVTVKYDVLLPSLYRGKKVYALMSGEITYWSIRLDGERHYTQAFINPRILQRYAYPGMKLDSKAAAKTIRTRVTFYSKDRRPLARVYYVPRKTSEAKVEAEFKEAEKALEVVKLPDTIFSRDKTPWAVLNFDKYEIIKKDK